MVNHLNTEQAPTKASLSVRQFSVVSAGVPVCALTTLSPALIRVAKKCSWIHILEIPCRCPQDYPCSIPREEIAKLENGSEWDGSNEIVLNTTLLGCVSRAIRRYRQEKITSSPDPDSFDYFTGSPQFTERIEAGQVIRSKVFDTTTYYRELTCFGNGRSLLDFDRNCYSASAKINVRLHQNTHDGVTTSERERIKAPEREVTWEPTPRSI